MQGGIFLWKKKGRKYGRCKNREAESKRDHDKLEEGLKELFESEKYKSYLSTMSKFHNYSFNNTILIALQKPKASLVAGFKAWQTNFNRHVKKGEKGIRILAPAPYKVKEESRLSIKRLRKKSGGRNLMKSL